MTKRTTSHAKEIHLESDKPSALDRYGVVTSHFEHARDPEVSNMHWEIHEERQLQKEKEAEEAAKGSFLDREESMLPTYKEEANRRLGIDQATSPQTELSAEFDRSGSESASDGSGGSQMVEQAGSKNQMQPPDTLETRLQNAQSHAMRMAKDDYLSKSYQEALVKGPNAENSPNEGWDLDSSRGTANGATENASDRSADKEDGWEPG